MRRLLLSATDSGRVFATMQTAYRASYGTDWATNFGQFLPSGAIAAPLDWTAFKPVEHFEKLVAPPEQDPEEILPSIY